MKNDYHAASCQNCDRDCCVLLGLYLRDATIDEVKEFQEDDCVCPNWFHYGKNGKVYHIETEDEWIDDEWALKEKEIP